MDSVADFYLPRTIWRTHGKHRAQGSLGAMRELDAYVLLGDPGLGKSYAFEHEALTCGGLYIPAPDLTIRAEECKGRLLFIDGLDELRAGTLNGRTPLDHIRQFLHQLGRPQFRLSCREIDWVGESDRLALAAVSPNGHIDELHLEELADPDVLAMLRHEGIVDPERFLARAADEQLDAIFRNPNMLKLLVKAVGDSDEWPSTKTLLYEAACQTLVRETNRGHLAAIRGEVPSTESLLDAAGLLSAVLLLSGEASVHPDTHLVGPGQIQFRDLTFTAGLPLRAALATNLFRGPQEAGRGYQHRSVAEFLAGRFISRRVDNDLLPIERLLALCTGEDGGVSPDLRGLCAWLAAHSHTARLVFVERDPLGALLYGDVSNYLPQDKEGLFHGLRREVSQFVGFRRQDWTSKPFGLLATRDMLGFLEANLKNDAASDEEQAFQDCVIDAVKHGEALPELIPYLNRIARHPNYWNSVREGAVKAIFHVSPSPAMTLLPLLDDIQASVVQDDEDELLGYLLKVLYGASLLAPGKVLDYFRAPKNDRLIGRYHSFWSRQLANLAPTPDLPILLEDFQARRVPRSSALDTHLGRTVAGNLLVATLNACGDNALPEVVFRWLKVGLTLWDGDMLDDSHRRQVAEWITARPEVFKSVVKQQVESCRGLDVEKMKERLRRVDTQLFGAEAPADVVEWMLTQGADEADAVISKQYFNSAVLQLHWRDRSEFLSWTSLELLDEWVARYPKFGPWREDATSMPLDHWKRDHYHRDVEWKRKRAERLAGWRAYIRRLLPQIEDGSAPPGVLSDLAHMSQGHLADASGNSPKERLMHFFDGDEEVVGRILAGMPKVLSRNDLPSVEVVIADDLKRKDAPFLVPGLLAIEMAFAELGNAALDLDTATLKTLCAFRLAGTEGDWAWFNALAYQRPALVAGVLVPYATSILRTKRDSVTCVYQLGHVQHFAGVAAIAAPEILETFPHQARTNQVFYILSPLLKAAMQFADRDRLIGIVRAKLAQEKLDRAQRTYWLGCGLLLDPDRFAEQAIGYVRGHPARIDHLVYLLGGHNWAFEIPHEQLPDNVVIALLKIMAHRTSMPPIGVQRRLQPGDARSELARFFFRVLERRMSNEVVDGLIDLSRDPAFEAWHMTARSTLFNVRLSRRKASVPALTPIKVCQILANEGPANVADLQAMLMDQLRDIARHIRGGPANGWAQFWNTPYKQAPSPRLENECRDVLIMRLDERLKRFKVGIANAKEGHASNEQRVDILVSFGGPQGPVHPIEVKRENYRKGKQTIWTALHSQLRDRYSTLPGAKGHGIYLVFWFGGRDCPRGPQGQKPASAKDLEDQLGALRDPSDNRLQVIVIDVALPDEKPQPSKRRKTQAQIAANE